MTTRHAALLALLPFAPKTTTARELVARLRDQGFTVTRRSVQRELVVLARVLPIRVDATEKPYLWSWSACPCGRTA
jgi:arginine repressor